MKLVDIVRYFESEELLHSLLADLKLDMESENVVVYMKDSISLDSDIYFFEEDETKDLIELTRNGIKYFQLFPAELGVEFYSYFKEAFSSGKFTDQQKARRLLEYVINDA